MNIDLNNFKSCYNPLLFLDDLKNTSPYISQQPEDSLVNKMLYRSHFDATEKIKMIKTLIENILESRQFSGSFFNNSSSYCRLPDKSILTT